MDMMEMDRLVLRTWHLDDADALFKIYSNPELYRFTTSDPFPDVETTRRYMEEYFINYQKKYGIEAFSISGALSNLSWHIRQIAIPSIKESLARHLSHFVAR